MSRLEERIRYVVEGRNRVEQRLAELKAQHQQWQERSTQAEEELESIAEQIAVAEEQSEILAAQAEEQSPNLPTIEDACVRRKARPTSSESMSRRCSSRSRCWPPRAATSMSSRAQLAHPA